MSNTAKSPERITRERINLSSNDDSFDDNDDNVRGKSLFHLNRLLVLLAMIALLFLVIELPRPVNIFKWTTRLKLFKSTVAVVPRAAFLS